MITMHRLLLSLLLFLGIACTSPVAPAPTPAPTATPALDRWKIVWHDEFDGNTLNPENWVVETGAGGWGNNELQFYTDRLENLRLENGMLVIEARRESYQGSPYTSARIKTEGRHQWRYGRFEARMKLPQGKGIWPAFWMLGADIGEVGWPRCGEIDIVEYLGEPFTFYSALHGPGYARENGLLQALSVPSSPPSESSHRYAIEWEPGEIRWYVDDVLLRRTSRADVPSPWVFDHPFFLVLNVAVGGDWPGFPDESTVFPQQLLVDYVRVYQAALNQP